jgi:hypothetical protein
MKRRALLKGLGMAVVGTSLPHAAQATLVSGLTLAQLVTRSTHIVVLTALDASSLYADLSGHRRIVTDVRARVEDVLAKSSPQAPELTLRTLGGNIGHVGQLVLGQPVLSLGSSDVAFVKRGADGRYWFVGMAQGHYPLRGALREEPRLSHSTNLPEIRDFAHSAVRRLSGSRLGAARQLVQEASQ